MTKPRASTAIFIASLIAGLYYWPFMIVALALAAASQGPAVALVVGLSLDLAYGAPPHSLPLAGPLLFPATLTAVVLSVTAYLGKKLTRAGERSGARR